VQPFAAIPFSSCLAAKGFRYRIAKGVYVPGSIYAILAPISCIHACYNKFNYYSMLNTKALVVVLVQRSAKA